MWNRFRYALFKAINRLNWWIIPEPQRSRLYYDFHVRLGELKRHHAEH